MLNAENWHEVKRYYLHIVDDLVIGHADTWEKLMLRVNGDWYKLSHDKYDAELVVDTLHGDIIQVYVQSAVSSGPNCLNNDKFRQLAEQYLKNNNIFDQ